MRILISARERLLRIRKDIEGHIRGILKTYGIRLAPVTVTRQRASFRTQLRTVARDRPALELIATSFIVAHEAAQRVRGNRERIGAAGSG